MIETILAENLPIIIFAKDKNSKYLFCNEATAEAAGLDSPRQIIGKTDYDLFWRQYAEIYRDCDRDVMRGKVVINEQFPFIDTKKISTILSCETLLKVYNTICPKNINEKLFNKASVRNFDKLMSSNTLIVLFTSVIVNKDMECKKLLNRIRVTITFHLLCNKYYTKTVYKI